MPVKTAPIALAATLALSGAALAQSPLAVVATTGMIADVAAEIGGDCVAVTTLMGPGVDPHLYKATARDVQTLNTAGLILYSGLHLEGQLGEVLARFSERIPTLAVAEEAIPEAERISTGEGYGVDPHAWMDAGLWALTVPVIAEAIVEAAPDCAGPIAERADAYEAQLSALDEWAAASIASIPDNQRVLVTAHDAFAYFGRAYDIEVAGIQGISTEAEAAIADIRATAGLLVERGIPAVFVESTINPRTIQSVIDAAGRAGQQVAIGGELFSDAMGETGTAEGTYIGMIHANVTAITEALGGTPAPLPEALAGWAAQWSIQ